MDGELEKFVADISVLEKEGKKDGSYDGGTAYLLSEAAFRAGKKYGGLLNFHTSALRGFTEDSFFVWETKEERLNYILDLLSIEDTDKEELEQAKLDLEKYKMLLMETILRMRKAETSLEVEACLARRKQPG